MWYSSKVQKMFTTPNTIPHLGGIGVQHGRSTPLQFFPSQEPLSSDQNTNLRAMYKQSISSVPHPTKKKFIGGSFDSYGYLNKIKAINVGKYAYKSRPNISTKSYDPNAIHTILNRVRNN